MNVVVLPFATIAQTVPLRLDQLFLLLARKLRLLQVTALGGAGKDSGQHDSENVHEEKDHELKVQNPWHGIVQ